MTKSFSCKPNVCFSLSGYELRLLHCICSFMPNRFEFPLPTDQCFVEVLLLFQQVSIEMFTDVRSHTVCCVQWRKQATVLLPNRQHSGKFACSRWFALV